MTDSSMVRDATLDDLEQLADVWHESWHDAHAAIVPRELIRIRTRDNFRSRLPAMLPDLRVAVPNGGIVGLCAIREDELYQLFVARDAGPGHVLTRRLAV